MKHGVFFVGCGNPRFWDYLGALTAMGNNVKIKGLVDPGIRQFRLRLPPESKAYEVFPSGLWMKRSIAEIPDGEARSGSIALVLIPGPDRLDAVWELGKHGFRTVMIEEDPDAHFQRLIDSQRILGVMKKYPTLHIVSIFVKQSERDVENLTQSLEKAISKVAMPFVASTNEQAVSP